MAIKPLHGSVIYYFSPLNKRFKCKLTIPIIYSVILFVNKLTLKGEN